MGNTVHTGCCASDTTGDAVDVDLPGITSVVEGEKLPPAPPEIPQDLQEAEAETKRKENEAEEARRQEEIRKEEIRKEEFTKEEETKQKEKEEAEKEEAEKKRLEEEAAAAAPVPNAEEAAAEPFALTIVFDDNGKLSGVTFDKRPLGFSLAVENKKGGFFSKGKPSPTGRIMVAAVSSEALRTTNRVTAGMIVRKLNDQDIKEPITWDEFTAIFLSLCKQLPSDSA
eukprot:TRINITY_DN8388_c0_g1_i1.p2 TRINITY_DN8388_c0_g1~~TRINITY_DN8388_c0_g1_i1.p2  ORF type:complete len:227 (+),score=78.36 TRINITY_DN8388_c0_g1_i1:68-748(+)